VTFEFQHVDIPFDIRETKGILSKDIKELIKEKLNKDVIKILDICDKKIVKTRKLLLVNGNPLRLDTKHSPNVTRLQILASESNINIPKVIFVHNKYKVSEWIEGVLIKNVWDIPEVFEKSGELIGKLNCIKDPINNEFLFNSDFHGSNAVWTKDKKVYLIDHGKLATSMTIDGVIVKLLLKRIRSKERINIFLKAYSKYKNIDNIVRKIEKKNWNWNEIFTLKNNDIPLKY